VFQEVEQELGLAALGAKMDVGNKDAAKPKRRLQLFHFLPGSLMDS
jgi:hypothetical protein